MLCINNQGVKKSLKQTHVRKGSEKGPTFSLSVLIWMAFGMSLAVFSFVIEVTSFSRIVI